LVSDIKEKHRLRVFKNRMLRRIFGPKRDKVKEDEIGSACSLNGEKRTVYRILV
jgi:hypothetical protein